MNHHLVRSNSVQPCERKYGRILDTKIIQWGKAWKQVPGPVSETVTLKLKKVLQRNPGFEKMKNVCSIVQGESFNCQLPWVPAALAAMKFAPMTSSSEDDNAGEMNPETPKVTQHLHCVEGKPQKKPQPGNLPRPGIEPGPPGFAARRANRYSTEQPGQFQRVRDSLRRRAEECIAMNGRHIEHLL
ncbi:hypothetical protein ANN_19863 [Periplaneta americana]|uniref:Uncharacterized protein n=1 Tax=Periplaneta americana TaxID=6978 RepID=A0ABQ8SBQ2_PERAM|nr:hypothetical protein ANN_19863 [Periplaneta americana]